jgi:hypothetical protein
MAVECEEVQQLTRAFSLVRDCYRLPNGALRLATSLQYPNGALVDVFLSQDQGLFKGYKLSDYGQTAVYLSNLRIKLTGTRKRRQVIDDICDALGVRLESDHFVIHMPQEEIDKTPDAVARLAQACARVADLSLMQRFPITSVFEDEVEEFISNADLPYELDVPLEGRFGAEVSIDFRVRGEERYSLVKTVSTGNRSSAHEIMNEVLRCWVDLERYAEENQFVTVVDDRDMPAMVAVYREEDLARIGEFSKLVAFPSQHRELGAVLQAA